MTEDKDRQNYTIDGYETIFKEMEKEIQDYREALKFYGGETINYSKGYDYGEGYVEYDGGKIASEVLEKYEKGK